MKVVVTGATGFVGRYVVPCLLKAGCEVVALSRSLENAIGYDDENFFVAKYEIGSNEKIDESLIKDTDVLLHLAWGNVNEVNSDVHLNNHLPMHYEFIKQVIEFGVKNIFVLGSCYEYGMCKGSIKEDHTTKPVTAYGISKDRLRSQLVQLGNDISFNLTWGRLFFVYGEGQVHSSIYNQLMSAIKNGDAEFKMSKGDQVLDYIQVHEAADTIVKLVMKKSNIGCVNICSGNPITLLSLVERWLDEEYASVKLVLGAYPYRSYEPKSFWGNRSYLDSILKL